MVTDPRIHTRQPLQNMRVVIGHNGCYFMQTPMHLAKISRLPSPKLYVSFIMAQPLKNPDAGPRIRVNLTIDPEVYPAARDRAHASGLSISQVITELLGKWLRNEVTL